MSDPVTCCARVAKGSDGFRTRYVPCSRAGKVEREGKWYCGQHDPQAKANRRQKASEEWAAKREAEKQHYRLMKAAPELLALLIESQGYTGGDWRARRDAAIAKATGVQNAET